MIVLQQFLSAHSAMSTGDQLALLAGGVSGEKPLSILAGCTSI